MRIAKCLLAANLLALLGWHPGAVASPAVEIRMRSVVAAPAGPLLLGDAAVIHAADLDTISNLVALPLGHAPSAGREAVLRRETIVRWVRTRTGLSASDIIWTGAEEIVVRGRDGSNAPAAERMPEAATVRKGDWARLRARAGAIEIEDRVEILQNGSTGDLVQVRGAASSASFTARVIARGMVEANP